MGAFENLARFSARCLKTSAHPDGRSRKRDSSLATKIVLLAGGLLVIAWIGFLFFLIYNLFEWLLA